MIKIIGDYPQIQRVVTGFHSMDIALSNKNEVGIPLTIWDVSGYSGIGKSTFVLSLAGMIAAASKKNIAISPIEELDKSLMTSVLEMKGFDGEVHILLDENDEKTIDALLEDIAKEETAVGILDSVGAISPIAELNADSIADVNMGRRAQLMAKLSRHILHTQRFRKSPLSFFMISHLHAVIGGRGSITSGGVVKRYLSKVCIRLARKETFECDGSYILEGTVEKLSYGQSGRKFRVFCLAGKGLHPGLSALSDCELYKFVKRATEKAPITMGKEKYPKYSTFIAEAHAGNDKVFKPFITALKDTVVDTVSSDDEEIPKDDTE
jgi:RecA/RadA recombinase